jgi:hypothetical protein
VSVAGAVRRFSYGLVAAAMVWPLQLTCHWYELGYVALGWGVPRWQIRCGVTGERPSAVVLAAR